MNSLEQSAAHNRRSPVSGGWGDRPLAHKDGIRLVFGLLMASGAMCPKCGFGTRVTSKKWARCKKCGERVERVKMEDIKVVRRQQGLPNAGDVARPGGGATPKEKTL